MKPSIRARVTGFGAKRGTEVVVYALREGAAKGVEVSDALALFECLRRVGMARRLDLILTANGGQISAARKIAVLLREYAKDLTVFVPYKARSAATLLCLGADSLVMGPFGELSPFDSHILAASEPSAKTPAAISSEDIKNFSAMAKDWFGLSSTESRTRVFEVLGSRVFPTTLTAFFRADAYLRSVAAGQLKLHLPTASPSKIHAIVNQFLSGMPEHRHGFVRGDLKRMGLNVRNASSYEEGAIWDIGRECQGDMDSAPSDADLRKNGVILSRDYCAEFVVLMPAAAALAPEKPATKDRDLEKYAYGRWRASYERR